MDTSLESSAVGRACFLDELRVAAQPAGLHLKHKLLRYEAGQQLERELETLEPGGQGQAVFTLEKFLGGGFAGQVYLARLTQWTPADEAARGAELTPGRLYTLKILIPPHPGARRFRDLLYWLAFQVPFAAQVQASACRAGLLWQKVIRRAARACFGRAEAVKDAYAMFWDPELGAYGEVTEWIEGRLWHLETDPAPARRWAWRTRAPLATGSPEYVGKRRFMARMVTMLHAVGAGEFARQYEWWTLKSQPNVMLRTDQGPSHPEESLCAMDFRAGLALLPILPMSPADFRLIAVGLGRGALVQFDRGAPERAVAFARAHPAAFADSDHLLAALTENERSYRRSQPDIWRQGLRLLWDADLRRDVRAGLICGYVATGLADPAFGERLAQGGILFTGFYLLGAVPLLGRGLRRLWGRAAIRAHWRAWLTDAAYRRLALRAQAAASLRTWIQTGRIEPERARRLLARPGCWLVEALLVGWLPRGLHRLLVRPVLLWERLRAGVTFLLRFIREADFREQWFLAQLAAGLRAGMLTPEEHQEIAACVRDPFIVKYLKCLGAHFATLPVTQVVGLVGGGAAALWMLAHGAPWLEALGMIALVMGLLQVLPISPGSIARGLIVVYLMIRERNLRDYLVAAPLSFVKYLGYLAFPLQMTATYPQLARFMAARWATNAVHIVPVFGEPGAWLEHAVFDLFFNWPQALARWARPRLRRLLTAWLLMGVALTWLIINGCALEPTGKAGLNVILAMTVLFGGPRLLYAILRRR